MKIKRSAIVGTVVSVALALIMLAAALIMPATAAGTTYANNTFQSHSIGAYPSTYITSPSLAKVEWDGSSNKVVRLDCVPATAAGTTCAEYLLYPGSRVYEVENGQVTINSVSYPVENGQATINDTVYYTSTDARLKEMRYGSGENNVDKNLIVANSEVSYTAANKVYLQAEYYVSGDAKGSVESQFYAFAHSGGDANWLHLYSLDLTNARLKTTYASAPFNSLKRDAWNTVTLVYDLVNGTKDFYINNVYSFSDNTASYKNITLKENKWIVAKLNKDASGNYAGYIKIDNAKIATFEDSSVYAPAATDASGNKLAYLDVTSSVTAKHRLPYEGAKVFNAGGATVTPVYLTKSEYGAVVAPIPGASIRLTNAAGIRFGTQLDLDILEQLLALKEAGLVSNVSIGTVIAPRSYVDAAGVFTMEGLDANLSFEGSKYLNVKATIGYYYSKLAGVTMDSGYDACFVGSITNVKLGNRDKEFSAVGYVKVDLCSGDSAYFYSYDYNASTIENYSRSVKGIALTALGDTNAGWTKAQIAVLNSFANGATSLSLSSTSVIQDVQYTSNEFYFRNAAGVYCRLTYEGLNGWRFQANGTSYDGFDETGAGQALSLYLGEQVLDKTEHLTVTTDASTVKIAAEGTSTYVKLNYTGSFNMQFYSDSGTVVSNVNTVSVSNTATATSTGTVTVGGALASGEAVYGGGERFDVVNRRGTAIDLYTADGWNSTATTYMAIPLFTTSRGAGIFVNRYENMNADFRNDAWSIVIKNEMIDCYFYATGKMTDALLGYTEISGHASLPEEWAQGELICRYSPDMRNFEDSVEYTSTYASHKNLYGTDYNTYGVKATGYSSYKDIPNYTNYYVKSSYGSSYKKAASSGMTLYDTNKLYTDDTGSKVAFAKVGSTYYALGKNWATLAEADAIGTQYYNYDVLYRVTFTDGVAASLNATLPYAYYKQDDGTYRKLGAKGNIGGYGVKTIVNNLINAGMKPTAMIMEPFGWSNISTNQTKYDELKMTVEWLQEKDIKAMFYMGVGSISGSMAGYKPEYRVWATLTNTDDGTVTKTDYIPKTSGTGTNPDVGTSSGQYYIDVTNPEAVDWYMNEIWGMMIDLGADGIKIDFCECMPDEGKYTNFDLKYDFYDDSVLDGDGVHHGYSSYFISIFYKSMLEQKAAKNIPDGFCVLSRGGGIGSQRNPYLWEGDQTRTFEKIEDQLIALINSGISGVPFMTYDMAGYQYASTGARTTGAMTEDEESEIFARAIEYTAFTSNIQTHGDVRQAYEMNETTKEIYRNYTDLHEQLIPYIQKYSKVACDTGMPVVRAMVLQYQNDTEVYGLETQYMFGDALLVAAITTEGATSKSVYLPAGTWRNLLTGETETGGQTITVNVSISQIPVFMKVDCDPKDQDLLADVFNGETWKKINGGVELKIEKVNKGDPWLEDPFLE